MTFCRMYDKIDSSTDLTNDSRSYSEGVTLVNRVVTTLALLAGSVMSAAKQSGDSRPAAEKWPGFLPAIKLFWLRGMSLGIIALVFAEGLMLARGKAQGWSFYISPREVVFEAAVRLIASALAGMLLGSVYTAIIGPFLWYFHSSRERLADWSTRVAVVVIVFLDSRLALASLIAWSHHGHSHRPIFDAILLKAHVLVFVIALCIPRARKEVVTSLDGFLGNKMTRRTALATVAGTAALATVEFAIGRKSAVVRAALVPERPKSNFLLVTFDALNAEDMSLYGRKLPTTPYLDAFASKATVFTNFYSASTFTTPSIATMLTGVYPSQSHVHQLEGRVRAQDTNKTLPHVMHAAGYATGAFLSNPFAYYLAKNLENDYDSLPEPVFQGGRFEHLWNATRFLHQDSGIGSRIDEYFDLENIWNYFAGIPSNTSMRFRPAASFEQSRKLLAKLPDGFFLWVHVITPHNPYLPDGAERGRFLPADQVRTFEEEFGNRWKPHYEPDQQSSVDQRRLRYDEFIATADRAFGTFISDLEHSGKLQNTTVIVSADHGESFEGGVYQHSSPYLTRPDIHIPLIIRTPGQEETHRVAYTADQTALAPTILELAGQSKPDWMAGRSLAGWLNRNGQGEGEGLAFTQYLEKNSAFKPLRHGTVGVIDGSYQYVLDLDTKKGSLRPLKEAQTWNLDRSAENPARAEALRAAIYSRFPELAH
jgi:arylsulfatase A-like enzyme